MRNAITLIEAEPAAARRLDFLAFWIGLASLLLAALGILAMTWIATRDRLRETGALRALCARREDIFRQFAYEAGTLDLVGTAAGVMLGWASFMLLARAADLPYRFDLDAALIAVLVALTLNIAFVCWPAL